MPGMPATTSKTYSLIRTNARVIVTFYLFLFAISLAPLTRGDTMLSFTAIAAALADRGATVMSVAQSIGSLGEQLGLEYVVTPKDANLGQVRIGVRHGEDYHSAPKYVQFYFSSNQLRSLAEVLPSCVHWTYVPNNPDLSPFRYACDFEGSSAHVKVVYIAEFTREIKDPASRLRKLLLQRNVW